MQEIVKFSVQNKNLLHKIAFFKQYTYTPYMYIGLFYAHESWSQQKYKKYGSEAKYGGGVIGLRGIEQCD